MFIKNNGEDLLENFYIIESMLKVTWEHCNNKELELNYYNLTGDNKYQLSQERITYLNMLSITLEKLQHSIEALEKYTDNCC